MSFRYSSRSVTAGSDDSFTVTVYESPPAGTMIQEVFLKRKPEPSKHGTLGSVLSLHRSGVRVASDPLRDLLSTVTRDTWQDFCKVLLKQVPQPNPTHAWFWDSMPSLMSPGIPGAPAA